MTTIQIQAPFTTAKLWILRDQDFSEAFPPILDGGTPMNLTGKNMEFWILPSFDNPSLLAKFSTETGEITYDDPVNGEAVIFVDRATIRSLLPKSPPAGWAFFWLLKEAGGPGTFYSELLRGPCHIADGNVAAV